MSYPVPPSLALDNTGAFNQLKQCLVNDPAPASQQVSEEIKPVLLQGLKSQTTQDQILTATAIPFSDGTNRVGIATVSVIRDEGLLKAQTNENAYTGTGTKDASLTVPTGKRWIIKSINTYYTSGTVTSATIDLGLNAGTMWVYVFYTASPAQTDYVNLPQPITLNAGDIVRGRHTVTVAGTNVGLVVAYVEYNV